MTRDIFHLKTELSLYMLRIIGSKVSCLKLFDGNVTNWSQICNVSDVSFNSMYASVIIIILHLPEELSGQTAYLIINGIFCNQKIEIVTFNFYDFSDLRKKLLRISHFKLFRNSFAVNSLDYINAIKPTRLILHKFEFSKFVKTKSVTVSIRDNYQFKQSIPIIGKFVACWFSGFRLRIISKLKNL